MILNLAFLQAVLKRITAVQKDIPETLQAKVFFEIFVEEFNNTLPRSVSSIERPDILSYFSSSLIYCIDYMAGSLEVKYAENTIQMRHSASNSDYQDSYGFIDSLALLQKVIALGENPCQTATPTQLEQTQTAQLSQQAHSNQLVPST